MHMRIVWGRILPGQWDGFEAAYKKASAMRGEVKGLKTQWLVRIRMTATRGIRSHFGTAMKTCVHFGIVLNGRKQWLSSSRSSLISTPPPTARLNSKRLTPSRVIIEPGV